MRLIEKAYALAKEDLKKDWSEVKGPGSNPLIRDCYKAVDGLGNPEMLDDSTTAWCFTGEEEILTEKGFVKFKDLNESHGKVAQVKKDTLEIEFVNPLKYIKYEYEGIGYKIETRSMTLKATKDHRFFGAWKNSNPEPELKTLDKITSAGLYIPKVKYGNNVNNNNYSDNDLEFIAAFISDGFFKYTSNKEKPWRINIQVSRERKIERLRNLNPVKEEVSSKVYGNKTKKPLTTFGFEVPTYFDDIFIDYKILKNEFILSLSKEQLKKYLYYYSCYDGSKTNVGCILYSAKKETVDSLTMIATLSGASCCVQENYSRLSMNPIWTLRINYKKEYTVIRPEHIFPILLKETVYCVSVPTELIVVRSCDGSPLVVGNCSCYVNKKIQDAGGKGTRSPAARSWLRWGREVTEPSEGDIVIFKRGNSSWQAHVAFFISKDEEYVQCLGGNQGNDVKISRYPIDNVISYRTSLD